MNNAICSMGLSRICAGAERKLCNTCPFVAKDTLRPVGDIEDLCRFEPANQRNRASAVVGRRQSSKASIDSTKIIKRNGYAAVKLATTYDVRSPVAKQQRRYLSLSSSSKAKVTLSDVADPPSPTACQQHRVSVTPFSSKEGRVMFKESLQQGYQEAYFKLSEQYQTLSRETSEQSKGSGVASLTMALNALGVDPINSTCLTKSPIWKGVWRWFSNDMVSSGINKISKSEDFGNIARKALIESKNCSVGSFGQCTLTSFRMHVQTAVSAPTSFLVAAFDKNAIFGSKSAECPFFSPIASYHPGSDSVLILDVDRENTQPYWVPLRDLHNSLFGYTILRREDSVGESAGVDQLVKAIQSNVHKNKEFERAVECINSDIEMSPDLKQVISQTKTHEHFSSSTPDAVAYTALMLSHPRDILLQGLTEKQQAFLWWMKKSDTKSVLQDKSDWLLKWNKQLSLIC
eukprot:TRINITY_DN1008_c7_g1_i2.p1 TRINITY_DN1008_c7_g1~~TRINITY_DN1008_c7_g1_i2.p1  ORF type:complete len:460 (+),score=56.72 TRINITY_DN1008_c7_g1_i2:103-1482(+)